MSEHPDNSPESLRFAINVLERRLDKVEGRLPTPPPSAAVTDALLIDFRLAADVLRQCSHLDADRLERGWNAMRAALQPPTAKEIER